MVWRKKIGRDLAWLELARHVRVGQACIYACVP